jgi:telomerase reverse transcriptase
MSSVPRQSLTLTILDLYFDEVVPLKRYLHEILKTSDSPNPGIPAIIANDEPQSYCDLLNTSYVGLKSDTSQRPSFVVTPPLMYMRDVMQKAHERLFLASRARPNNIIAMGYQRAPDNERVHTSSSGIYNRFINTVVTALHGPEWELMLQRIGADAMLHLLLNTSLFISLPNECLCQLTGEPIMFASLPPGGGFLDKGPHHQVQKRKRETPQQLQPRKRLKLIRTTTSYREQSVKPSTKGVSSQPIQRRTAADISFVRMRIFYAMPSRDPDAFRIIVGFPYHHVLNRLCPSYFKKPRVDAATYKDPDPRALAKDPRHLSKYIFPSQYGLSSVFMHRKQTYQQPDYSDREQEIKVLGNCKTPKRLKDVLSLVEKMIWRHGKCGYKPLRDKVCPSKVVSTNNQAMDSSIILEMVSEHSLRLETQPTRYNGDTSIDSNGNSILPQGLSQAKKHGMNKPRFIEFTCSYVEVFRYVMLVTKMVIPKQFWGSRKNFKLVQNYVREFIVARRFETVSLHRVLQGFTTTECDWLIPPGNPGCHHGRVPVTDSLKRRELLEEFMFWYFDSFVIPLVKTTFYVTDSSAFRNRVLYFRQDDWETLCAPLIDQLSEKTFKEIEKKEAEEILRQRRLGFSFVRLLPKETGVRPIVNLRRRMLKNKSLNLGRVQSINQILQTTFQILTYEKQRQPDLLGASVFGPNEIYAQLKAYKARLLKDHPSGILPKLYFVKVDVQACFDTIDQSTLLTILKELMSEDTYLVQKYGQITPVAGKIKRTYVKKAYPEDEHPDFVAYARDLANALRDTIFVDQVNYNLESRRTAMGLLEEHINENIVKIVGIPQGSVLSALLCCYCYGDLEARKLGGFGSSNDPQNLLLRLIDDYLFVTTCPRKAKSFLDTMIAGHPEYGCMISQEKTLTNFDYDVQIMNVTPPGQRFFPWCGLLIDMMDLSILADYTRYSGTALRDSLTVDKGRNPGVNFVHKMLRLAKSRSHIMYNDTSLNSPHTVHLNIYRSFLITAAKMHYYLEGWGVDVSKNGKFLHNTIRKMIQYTYAVIIQSSKNKVSRAHGGKCDVHKAHVLWLGKHAFHAVLKKFEVYESSLLRLLAFELALPRNRRIRHRFKRLVKESSPIMVSIGL